MRLGLLGGLLISLSMVITSMVGIWYSINLTRDLPSVDVLASLLEPPNGILLQPTRLYDRTHEHVILSLENPAAEGKQYIFIGTGRQTGDNQASHYLVDATIAGFDPGFWQEPGYTLTGISLGTHTTLAQLLISNLVLEGEPPSQRRNIRERLLAAQVTAKFGREKILEWYLNSAKYGELIYGADAAARVFFGKPAAQLSLAETAMLTAIAQSPSINPLTGSQFLKDRQELVIQWMLTYGFILPDEAQKALKEGIQFQAQIESRPLAPTFTDLVLMQLSPMMPLERIYRGGYDIVTTLDYGLQLQAACASQDQLKRLQGMQEQLVTTDGTPCDAALLLPTIKSGLETPLVDVSANVVILDPHSGQILALVGEEGSEIVPAYPTVHPAGTILSPFLYLTAFTRGMGPATLLWDIPGPSGMNVSDAEQSVLTQESLATYHGPVRLRMALANDYAGGATQVLQQVGPENVWLTEERFGIDLQDTGRATGMTLDDLYSQQISLLESVQAYGVFANQGVMAGQPDGRLNSGNSQVGLSPTSILSVAGMDGTVWLDWTKPQGMPIVSAQLAYLTTDVLQDERSRWPTLGHPNALEIGRPVGAKVSVTLDASDAWAVGYTPQLAVGVWIGHSQDLSGGILTEMPAELWHAIMQYASSQMPVQAFEVPTGVSLVQVCDPSGLLVSSLCPAVVQEVFLNGNEPTQEDDLYQKYYINRETGLLATIFTPSDMVEEKVFMVVPPQAVDWANGVGVPIPPDTYDNIYAPPHTSGEVQFTSPSMFDYAGGQVKLMGSAQGEGFSYYRIQVGQGLNPQQWIQIGEDVGTPVSAGALGTWDTTGLEGLYIVQLLVVRQDKKVDQALLQVTIDNTKPDVEILAPKMDEQFAYQQGESILMNVSVRDNLVLKGVEFYVDFELESTLFEPPFIILWDAQQGNHRLKVTAYDQAGNESEATTTFSVHK